MTTAPVLLTIDEAAVPLRSSRRHVERLIADKRIAVTRVGGKVFITEQAIADYLTAVTEPAVDPAPAPSLRAINRRNRGRRHLAAAGES